jgi:hypothetical protein
MYGHPFLKMGFKKFGGWGAETHNLNVMGKCTLMEETCRWDLEEICDRVFLAPPVCKWVPIRRAGSVLHRLLLVKRASRLHTVDGCSDAVGAMNRWRIAANAAPMIAIAILCITSSSMFCLSCIPRHRGTTRVPMIPGSKVPYWFGNPRIICALPQMMS